MNNKRAGKSLSLSLSLSKLTFLLPIFFLLTTISFITYQKPSQAANDSFNWNASDKVLTIQGDCKASEIATELSGEATQAEEVCFSGTIVITTDQGHSSPFAGAANLARITATEGTHVSFAAAQGAANPTLMYLFEDCSKLQSIAGLSSWDVSGVTGDWCMQGMFYGCTALTSLEPLSDWNVSGVTGEYCMRSMFTRCSALISLDGLSGWNVSGVTGDNCMYGMFRGCSALTSLELLSDWDVSNVTGFNCMSDMFAGCTSLTSLDGLSSWDVSDVTGEYCMQGMFSGCSALTSLEPLSDWGVSNVTGEGCMSSMFSGCSNLTSLEPLSDWGVSNVTGEGCMSSMFSGCSALTSLNGLSGWNVSNVAGNYCMNGMFSGCTSLKNIEAISSWKLKNAIDSTDGVFSMFDRCPISYIAGAASATEGFTPTSDMDISNLAAAKTWYPAEGGASVSGDSLLTGWTGDTGYAAQSSRWAVGDGSSPYVSTPLSWDPSKLPATYTYTGSLIPYNPEVSAGTQTLTKGTDYRLSYLYTSGNEDKVVGGLKEPGSYVISVVPQGNYTKAPSNTASVTVVAAPDTYIVSFDAEGGLPQPASQEVEEGTYIAEPLQPQKEGYSFLGWFRQGSDTPWNFASDTMPAEDIVLYAHWIEGPTPGPTPTTTGWVWEDTAWRYYTKDGSYLHSGWQWVADDTYGAHWYYFFSDGFCAMRDWIWDGTWYYIKDDCAMACGTWNWIDGAWYGFNWDGTMCTGWVWDNSYDGWYYCYSNGVMARNTWVDRYWVDNTGRWIR